MPKPRTDNLNVNILHLHTVVYSPRVSRRLLPVNVFSLLPLFPHLLCLFTDCALFFYCFPFWAEPISKRCLCWVIIKQRDNSSERHCLNDAIEIKLSVLFVTLAELKWEISAGQASCLWCSAGSQKSGCKANDWGLLQVRRCVRAPVTPPNALTACCISKPGGSHRRCQGEKCVGVISAAPSVSFALTLFQRSNPLWTRGSGFMQRKLDPLANQKVDYQKSILGHSAGSLSCAHQGRVLIILTCHD